MGFRNHLNFVEAPKKDNHPNGKIICNIIDSSKK